MHVFRFACMWQQAKSVSTLETAHLLTAQKKEIYGPSWKKTIVSSLCVWVLKLHDLHLETHLYRNYFCFSLASLVIISRWWQLIQWVVVLNNIPVLERYCDTLLLKMARFHILLVTGTLRMTAFYKELYWLICVDAWQQESWLVCRALLPLPAGSKMYPCSAW